MFSAETRCECAVGMSAYLRLSSQASHWAAFAGNALMSVGTSPAYRVRLPPAIHIYLLCKATTGVHTLY